MSINPVQAISQIVEERLANNNARPAQSPVPAAVPPNNPNAGTSPKPEVRQPEAASAGAELPHDVVHVQRDNQADGAVVVRYTDHAGNLILQVPSTQVLDIARDIEQDFRTEAKTRAATEAESKGGKSH